MKTAIIKTGIWKEDEIFNLLPEARLFYICLLTNPERNGTPAFKCSDRLLGFFTGFNDQVIQTCKRQLVDAGLIEIIDGYFLIREQDYVKAHKGKLSLALTNKEYESLPENIRERLMSRSCGTHESNSISIGNSKSNSIVEEKEKEKPIDPDAERLAKQLCSAVQENFDFVKCDPKDIKKWADDIEKLHRIDGYDWPIIGAVITWSQNDDFWKTNIRSGAKLRKQFQTLLIQAKVQHDNVKQRIF